MNLIAIERKIVTQLRYLLWMFLGLLLVSANFAQGHGDVQPQPIDTAGLTDLGDEWRLANPYKTTDSTALKVGKYAYKINCARCHGADGESNGLAPDLRELPNDSEGDEIFINRVRNGLKRNGVVQCPKFDPVMNQEAMWAIRTWLLTKEL